MSSGLRKSDIENEIDSLISDKTSGSRTIFRKALEILRKALTLGEDHFIQTLEYFVDRLRRAYPSMQIITGLCDMVTRELSGEGGIGRARKNITDYIGNSLRTMEESIRKIADAISEIVGKGNTAITISRSETVLEVLIELNRAGAVEDVIISESRPANEGTVMAESLASAGIGVTLTVDAAADSMCDHADFAIVGADTVFSDGSIANKTGTKSLALSCRARKMEFIVACESAKISDERGENFFSEIMPASEVYNPKNPKLKVINRYFEVVDSTLITHIITENGILKG